MGPIAGKLKLAACAAAAAAAAIAAGNAPAAALGGAPPDIRGVWEAGACTSGTLAACEASPEYPQKLAVETENFETGAVTGYGETVSGEKNATMTGSISGCILKTHYVQGSYTSEGTMTLNAAGTKLQGTFSDSFGRENDPSWASRASGQGCGAEGPASKQEEEKKKEETKGLRPTGTSVICNYEIATSQDVCGASVGDGGAGTPATPSGAVRFTATSGGFSSGAACSLSPTPLSPSVASCTVVFFASEAHLPTVTASYGGDAQHSGSTGHTQFLAAGLEEPSLSPSGPSGRYPNELQLETEVPASGTNLETTVALHESRPQPVPLAQPLVSGLDGVSAADLRSVEALAMLADVDGLQSAPVVKQLDGAIEKLDTRVAELDTSQAAADRAELGRMLEETNAEIEAVTKMEKERSELAKSIAAGGTARGLIQADGNVESVDEKIGELLKSPNPADQLRAQKDMEDVNRSFEEINKALQQREEISKKILQGIKASVSRRHGRHIVLRAVRPLGRLMARNLPAGRHKLAVKLDAARLRAAAGHRSSLPVIVRTAIVLPSKLLKAGLPRILIQPAVLHKR